MIKSKQRVIWKNPGNLMKHGRKKICRKNLLIWDVEIYQKVTKNTIFSISIQTFEIGNRARKSHIYVYINRTVNENENTRRKKVPL